MASAEFSSTGKPGLKPENRSFSRLYQTYPFPINNLSKIIEEFSSLIQSAELNGRRRAVFRFLCPNEILNQAIQSNLQPFIEAVIPLDIVTGHNESILFLGKNFHHSPRPGVNFALNTNIEKKPLYKIQSVIEKGYTLSNTLEISDRENLFALWNKFGWTMEGIEDFIVKIINKENNLWFSGIRDSNNQLVSASQAEGVSFSGINYIETTEYSTLDGSEGQGLCTTTVLGLIAQILKDTYYTTSINFPPVITAEFNTSSSSPAVGANAGFVIPNYPLIPQILSYNVAVIDGAPPNNVNFDQWEKNDGIPLHYLRDFAVAVLPQDNISNFYDKDDVWKIINLYNKRL